MKQEEALKEIENDFGFVPKLLKEMSISAPSPLAYTRGEKLTHEASLTQMEQQVVRLVTSLYNECGYCPSMHSRFTEKKGEEI